MLSTQNILSFDQGKLFAKPRNEDAYYARYMTAADKVEPAVPQQPRSWNLVRFALGGLLAQVAR